MRLIWACSVKVNDMLTIKNYKFPRLCSLTHFHPSKVKPLTHSVVSLYTGLMQAGSPGKLMVQTQSKFENLTAVGGRDSVSLKSKAGEPWVCLFESRRNFMSWFKQKASSPLNLTLSHNMGPESSTRHKSVVLDMILLHIMRSVVSTSHSNQTAETSLDYLCDSKTSWVKWFQHYQLCIVVSA